MIDLKDKRFGRLLVTSFSHINERRQACWNVVCDCGNTKFTSGVLLRNKQSKSCGCLVSEVWKKINLKHGLYLKKSYTVYNSMKARCYNKNHPKFKDYGGRGIAILPDWLGENGFKNFYRDMGEKPDGLEIDRIENNGNYEKYNCRWATRSQQMLNIRARTESGIKGIEKRRNGSYTARIMHQGKRFTMGTYKCPLLAVVAYENKLTELNGVI